MTAALTIHVLIVDDDRTFREPLRQYLARQEGEVRFEVEALARAAEVLKLGEQVRRFEVALIDQMLESEDEPPLTGTELMVRLKARAPDLEVVIMTGWGVQAEVGIESIRRGAYRYFAKFSQPEEIPLLVRAAYERREWRRLAGERDQAAAAAEAERRRAAEMETLNEIGRRIASVPGLDELPHLIFRETSRVLDTTNFFVAYYDGATDENDFRLRYEHGAELPPLRISAKRGLSGWVVRQRQRLFLPDGSRDFREREGIELVGEEARSWLGVPILSGDRVLGVIGAQEYEQTGKFDANHEKVLGVIASFAAAAMENAQAMARLRQEQDRYRRMVASSFDGILVVGRDGRLTECNPSAERILGYSRDELLGRSVGDLYSDLATGRRVNKLLHTNPDQRVTGERADVVSRNGEVIPIELSASLLFDAEGREIGSAGYFEDLRQRQILETRFDDLLEAVKGIASLLEPEPLASLILSTACKAIPVATKGSLHLYDSEIKQLIPSALYRYPAHLIELARFAPGEGFASEVFETGVPARISDASQDRRVKHLPEPALRSGSAICVPLIYQDASLGTLSLDNPEQLDAFTDDDVHLLEKYADMAAIALVNARRFHRSTQDLHAVQTVDGLLGHATHLDVTLELVVSVAQRQTNSDRTELYALVQPDAGQASLRLLAAAGGPAQPDVAFSRPLPTDDHAIAHVLMEGQTAQERQSNGDWRLLAPLKSPEGKPVGLLVLTREGAEEYDAGAQGLASTLAHQAAIALQHQTQFDALQERESQLHRQSLELENARQAQEVYGVVATMGMFGAEIAHSLAQKAFVVGNLAIQIRDFSRDQRVVDLTLRLEEEARRLAEFPLKISTPTSYPPVSSRLLLDDVLRQWGTGWCSAYNGIRAEMDLQCRGVAIHINEELFRGALHKLVENALHAMADTGGQLSLTSRVQNGRVGILLADTGPGIPERHRADFLRRKVEKDANEPGTGMGAIMARMVFQYYGGDVQLVATGTQGTTLLISLPLSPEVPRMSGVVQ